MSTTNHNQQLGKFGEELAVQALRAVGYEILSRNWRTRYGEIDIVAHRNDCLCAIEVKTRTHDTCGRPIESITYRKRKRMRTVFGQWLEAHPDRYYSQIRIDVVAIELWRKPIKVQHLKGVA